LLEKTLYLEHYGLEQAPFRQEPDPNIYFQGAGHPAVLQSLLVDIHAGTRLLKLTGREGVGKTLLSLLVTGKLPPETYDIIILDHPAGSYEDLLRVICLALNQEKNGEPTASRQYVQEFIDLLQERKKRHKRVLLIIDEAEKIFLATLERLVKIICDPDMDGVLQVLFIGRRELDNNLDRLRVFCSSIDIHTGYVLEPLDAEQTRKYLEYRLQSAGITDGKQTVVFNEDAAGEIYRAAGGNIRLTNTLAEKGLRESCARGIIRVEPGLVPPVQRRKKNDRSGFLQITGLIMRNKWWAAAAVFLLLVLVVMMFPKARTGQPPDAVKEAAVEKKGIETPLPAETKEKHSEPLPSAGQETQPGSANNADDNIGENRQALMPEEPVMPEPVPPQEMIAAPTAPPVEEKKEAEGPAAEQKVGEQQDALHPGESKKRIEPEISGLVVVEAQGRKKKINGKPAEVKQGVDAAAPDATELFNERLRATSNWLAWSYRGGYTIQLMMLTAGDAEENLKNMLLQDEYAPVREDMYIIKRNSPPALFVYYGMYDSLEEARQARNNLPPMLRGHQPYALSIEEALKKTRE